MLLQNIKKFLFGLVVCLPLLSFSLQAQQLTGIATQWNDSFAEWIIYTDIEGEEGELRLRWNTRNDWTQWEYRIGEYTGQIRTKWPNRIDEWETRGENLIVDARAVWRNDPREWRINSPEGHQYKWRSRYGNTFDEWVVDTERYGFFEMYTAFEGDPREWIIVDELEASLPEKMMLIFITIINNSMPKQ
ncbi:MAG: hypothetical protein AAGJ93_00130 [Bacteroidota bacterium]